MYWNFSEPLFMGSEYFTFILVEWLQMHPIFSWKKWKSRCQNWSVFLPTYANVFLKRCYKFQQTTCPGIIDNKPGLRAWELAYLLKHTYLKGFVLMDVSFLKLKWLIYCPVSILCLVFSANRLAIALMVYAVNCWLIKTGYNIVSC